MKIRVICKHCYHDTVIVLPGSRTKHLREKHPEQKGRYAHHFDFAEVENLHTDYKRIKH